MEIIYPRVRKREPDRDRGCVYGSSIGNNIANPGMNNPVVFTETGYGVNCSTDSMKVSWRNPEYTCSDNESTRVTAGLADYNSVCDNTNQEIVSKRPLEWTHETNTVRETPEQTVLWSEQSISEADEFTDGLIPLILVLITTFCGYAAAKKRTGL